MGGEELEGRRIEEVGHLKPAPYSIDLIDEHLATPHPHETGTGSACHEIAMDLHTDRYFCQPCDVWIEPPCDCKEGDNCPFPDQPAKPSLSSGTKERISEKGLENMRRRKNRPRPEKDACEKCHGEKGGTPGNENIVKGRVLCDYCHAEEMP